MPIIIIRDNTRPLSARWTLRLRGCAGARACGRVGVRPRARAGAPRPTAAPPEAAKPIPADAALSRTLGCFANAAVINVTDRRKSAVS